MKTIYQFGLCMIILTMISCGVKKSSTNTSRDGSSFKKAVIVNSIAEEYEYAQKDCKNCLILSQALVTKKKKYYDILKFKKPNGEVVSYYFDISNFFGKSF